MGNLMTQKTGSISLAVGLFSLTMACGSTSEGGPGGPDAGAAGTAAGAGNGGAADTAGGHATGGTSSAGSGGASGASNSATGGQNAATAGHAGVGGSSPLGGQGGSGGNATAGAANDGGAPSTAGLPFVGSCLAADHCTDEWDASFGAAVLEQFCVGQQGTWSTAHCVTAAWKKKCTQAVFSGVYVQFLPADGICAAGFEEAL